MIQGFQRHALAGQVDEQHGIVIAIAGCSRRSTADGCGGIVNGHQRRDALVVVAQILEAERRDFVSSMPLENGPGLRGSGGHE